MEEKPTSSSTQTFSWRVEDFQISLQHIGEGKSEQYLQLDSIRVVDKHRWTSKKLDKTEIEKITQGFFDDGVWVLKDMLCTGFNNSKNGTNEKGLNLRPPKKYK